MDFGAFLPYIVPTQIDRRTFLTWCRRIDEGPFATLAHGERWAWNTPEHVTTLGAIAVATERVRLWSFTYNFPMHPADFVAKRAATIDVLSDGRYTIVPGIGGAGRVQDWRSAEKTPLRFPHARLDAQIEQIRKLWAGEPPVEGGEPIGPRPVQPGGPPIHCSAKGPKALARATKWAAGYGNFMGPEPDSHRPPGSPQSDSPEHTATFLAMDAQRIRDAWREAGRTDEPYLTTSCFFGLGPGAEERLGEMGAAYLRVGQPEVRRDAFWIHNDDAVRTVVEQCQAAGYHQLIFIPTTNDLGELDRLAGLLASL